MAPLVTEPATHQCPPTPRTRHLLSLINSPSVEDIMSLEGVGVNRAEAIVNYLLEKDVHVTDLRHFQMLMLGVKGVGKHVVERMRDGIVIE